MNQTAKKVHQESIIIDATCPLANVGEYYRMWIEGGATVVAPTLCYGPVFMDHAMKNIGKWQKRLSDEKDKLIHIISIEDIFKAKEENKLGILFHFQGTTAFERDLNSIEIFHRLGLRVGQLCYNSRDFVGDGCAERTDSGLSHFGLNVISEFNRLGIVVDCAHTGYRTTMEAIEVSKKPVIISHGNTRSICDSFRNLRDDQIKEIAAKGGVIGINGYPAFVAKNPRPSIDNLIDHVDHISKLVGIEYISIGIDYYEGMAGIADDNAAEKLYKNLVRSGVWNPRDYPPPPWWYPKGMETPNKLINLTDGLLKRRYSQADVKKILGLNLIRVFKEVWK